MKDRLNDNCEKTYDDQHLHWRERHLTATTDIVAYQIARARHQLEERVGERAGVHAPKQSNTLPYRLPPHAPYFSMLAATRTEVVGKLSATVMTMLHAILMPVLVVWLRLLPAADAMVVFFIFSLFIKPNPVEL